MLDKIKQWTLRVLEGNSTESFRESCHEDPVETALRSLQECTLDPRELPRPHRIHDSGGESKDGEPKCCCHNCVHLSHELLECAICLEPLTSTTKRGVSSCLECGNIACLSCASKLSRCPYCRTDNALRPNVALKRLIYKLNIPCRNSVLPVRCPHRKCEWRGDIDSLSAHLEKVHLVTILNGSSVTLDIAEFQRKAELSESRPRYYSVILSCFSGVFVCKVVLNQSKLRVMLSQITRTKNRHMAAWIEISCVSKIMKGIIQLSRNKSEIEVPVTNFVAPAKENGDRVSISISVRPLS